MNRPALLLAVVTLTVPLGVATAAPASAAVPTCHGFNATIVGTTGPDTLFGTRGNDVIVAKAGNDLIQGFGGNDILCGDGGSDKLYGGAGSDYLYGGRDALVNGANGPTKNGDALTGGPGKDYLQPDFDGRPADHIRPDSLLWDTAAHGVTVNITGRTATGAGADVFTEVGALFVGSPFADTFLGSANADLIDGNGGGDVIFGSGGNDRLLGDGVGPSAADDDLITGGDGDDTIYTTFGRDDVRGGAGDDNIVDITGAPDSLDGGADNDHILTELAAPSAVATQTLTGGDGDADQIVLLANLVNPGGTTATGTWVMATGAMEYTVTDPFEVTATGFENILLSTYGATWTIEGTAANESVSAAATIGATFDGLDGDDTFLGSVGNDTFDGGPGTDEALAMGSGADTCISVETIDVNDCEDVSS